MTSKPGQTRDELQALLEKAGSGAGMRSGRRWLLPGLALAAIAALFLFFSDGGNGDEQQYLTEAVTTGKLVVTASATGTLQPTKSVDVGSELSGTLATVLVQENDTVRKGQLLAELDRSRLTDTVAKSRAAVNSAEARVAQARATVAESQASLARMRRVAELSGGKVPARAELDTAQATMQRAVANELAARADAAQARAALKTDETNLGKAMIRSPVDGVVLARKVEPGNTVVAAMNTPVLFVIAEDLARMELQVKVDEADVSSVREGQPASFTVAAWPGRSFPATIQRVGLGSTTTDNVVTYKTVLQVSNDDLALRPGMTATASIITAERKDALLVPNTALRFTPPAAASTKPRRNLVNSLVPRPPVAPRRSAAANRAGPARVWVLADGRPREVPVKTGVSNGRYTEIIDGELKAGMAVITALQEAPK